MRQNWNTYFPPKGRNFRSSSGSLTEGLPGQFRSSTLRWSSTKDFFGISSSTMLTPKWPESFLNRNRSSSFEECSIKGSFVHSKPQSGDNWSSRFLCVPLRDWSKSTHLCEPSGARSKFLVSWETRKSYRDSTSPQCRRPLPNWPPISMFGGNAHRPIHPLLG